MLCALSVCVDNLYSSINYLIDTTKKSHVKEFYVTMFNLIFQHGRVAGGFLLNLISKNFTSFDFDRRKNVIRSKRDIDVYMSTDEFAKFASNYKIFLAKWKQQYSKEITRNPHQSLHFIYSGFAENSQGIRFHIKLRYYKLSLDIVVCNNPLDAVKNFDLTFCMCSVFHESKDEFAPGQQLFLKENLRLHVEHIDDVYNRRGKLSQPFAKEYYNGNKTTVNRISKYLTRGYTIEIPILKEYTNKENIILNRLNYNLLLSNRANISDGVRLLRHMLNIIFFKLDLDVVSDYSETGAYFQKIRELFTLNVNRLGLGNRNIRKIENKLQNIKVDQRSTL
tara:strand:+ start:1590 stop:2597 length:1008 start_codon:yes stop_codon:yes gene_type:complete